MDVGILPENLEEYEARNAKMEGFRCAHKAENTATLSGSETAADRQGISGPLFDLVFPFLDIMFPRAVPDHVVLMVSHHSSDIANSTGPFPQIRC